jgi:hypothetical protein
MSFFDFAQAAREKGRTTTNPFFKHFETTPTQPLTTVGSIPTSTPSPTQLPTASLSSFSAQATQLPTASLSSFSAQSTLEEPNVESLAKVSGQMFRKTFQPSGRTTSIEQTVNEENIEQHIRKLEEGFAAIQSWAQMQTNVLETLKAEVEETSQDIGAFLAGLGFSQQS